MTTEPRSTSDASTRSDWKPHAGDDIVCGNRGVPTWWSRTFLASIVFAPLYLFFYHNGAEGRTAMNRFDRALAANMELQLAKLGNLEMNEASVRRFLDDDAWLQVGKGVFKQHCVQCHAADGGGNVGPNLCDDAYKNVRDLGDFLTVLNRGAGGGAMPAWKNKLDDNQIVLVSSYVASLRGSKPAAPKAAEGQKIPAW